MNKYVFLKSFLLASVFIKEQLKEPVALFWIIVSPVVTFYLLMYSRNSSYSPSNDYISSTSWFYAFVASSVALFGLAFYIVGRRESGFVRSFIYTFRAKSIFLIGQFVAYSFISIIYCSVFYVFTRISFGSLGVLEFLVVLARFYVCFILFSALALMLTLIPVGFQNTNTVFSVLSFTMLAVGIVSVGAQHPVVEVVKLFNPLWWANVIMVEGVSNSPLVAMVAILMFVISFFITLRFLLINPVWSRY